MFQNDERADYAEVFGESFSRKEIERNLAGQGHSEETISEIFELLESRIPQFIEDIALALDPVDTERIALHAHAAKGVLNTIHLTTAAERAQNLEVVARSGDHEEIVRLGRQFLQLLRYLNGILDET